MRNDPPRPAVLHVNYVTGRLTEGWLQNQVATAIRYQSWLLTRSVANGSVRSPNWIVSDDRLLQRLLHLAAAKTGGRSAALLASSLPLAPNVVHAHFGPVAWAHRRLASRLNAPLAVGFYGADATARYFVASSKWRRRYSDLFAQAAGIFAEGPAMATRLVGLGASPDKVHVVPLAADAASLGDLSWAPPAEGAFRFIAGGRFTEKKGFDTAIRAFARAFGPRDDVELCLVGAGPDDTALRRLAGSHGVTEKVTFVGALPHAQFIARFAGAHMALFPSRRAVDGDSEGGAPVTIIEAQWVGTPVIVSDHDDLSFVAAPDSLVAPARDVDRWAELMRTVVDDRARLPLMSSGARRHARAQHSPEGNARKRESLYDYMRA